MEERVGRVHLLTLYSLSSIRLNKLFWELPQSLVSFSIHCYPCLSFLVCSYEHQTKVTDQSLPPKGYCLQFLRRCQAELWTPEEDSNPFCPLHLGVWVARENMMPSSTGWSRAVLTWRRNRARSTSGGGGSVPHGPVADAGKLASVHPSIPQWKEPCPLPLECRCNGGLGKHYILHTL